jgi:ABC-2 type transport system permease protein
MTDIALITLAGIKNNLRSRVVAVVAVSVVLICAVGLAAAFSIIFIAPAVKVPSPDRSQVEMYLSLILSVTSFLGLGVNMNAFAFQTMTREKSRGIIQSLLATPLKAQDIWLGKSLAVFLPGLVMGEIFTLIALLAVNYIFIVSEMGFLINLPIIISSFVAIPLIYLSLSVLVHLVGLSGKPVGGNVIVQIFLPVMVALTINLVLRSVLDASSWTLTGVFIGIAVVIGVISLVLRSRLTRERIVLSG